MLFPNIRYAGCQLCFYMFGEPVKSFLNENYSKLYMNQSPTQGFA